jgi:deazaflavin-dependent oxidoreductase (nitroreductase family)
MGYDGKRHALQTVGGKLLSVTHVGLYRLSGGRVGSRFGKRTLLLLTTTGRKSGKSRTLPLQYIRDGSSYVVAASNWGKTRGPAWWLNLRAQPRAQIQVGARVMQVTVEQASTEHRIRLWPLLVVQDPTFARYQRGTTREIPLMVLTPATE